jgi:hypothetical protein
MLLNTFTIMPCELHAATTRKVAPADASCEHASCCAQGTCPGDLSRVCAVPCAVTASCGLGSACDAPGGLPCMQCPKRAWQPVLLRHYLYMESACYALGSSTS